MLEKYSDFFIPLMKLLDELPDRTGQSYYIFELFKQKYGDQISPEQLSKNSGGRVRWAYNVQMCCTHLKKTGYVTSPANGIWHLTEKGHQWLLNNPRAAYISPISGRSRQVEVNHPTASNTARDWETSDETTFFTHLQARLEDLLKPILGENRFSFTQRGNYLQIRIAGFSGCHFEIILRQDRHEIALHFESSPDVSRVRLQAFEPYLEELSRKINIPVKAGNHQSRGFTQVKIEGRANNLLSPELAEQYAKVVTRFIKATFPILQQVYEGQRSSQSKQARAIVQNIDTARIILEREIQTIRDYLVGQSSQQPSDEKICDWVNFCYTFAMYTEGKELFFLVNSKEVHPWYYERTKKIARLCELRA